MLTHKEEIDAKDTEIALLKARLLALDTNQQENIDISSHLITTQRYAASYRA